MSSIGNIGGKSGVKIMKIIVAPEINYLVGWIEVAWYSTHIFIGPSEVRASAEQLR